VSVTVNHLPESARVRLLHQLDCLPVLIGTASPEKLEQCPDSGKWSAAQNLAHLARYHEIFFGRITRILAEERPEFQRYKAEEDDEWSSWMDLPFAQVAERLRQSRNHLIQVIERLDGSAFARTGIHPVFGEMTLLVWLEFFLLHEAHHLLAVLQRVRES
jgi:uncharacterized damage-inducible protein DinB